MAFILKNIIFDFFGVRDRINDVSKDSNNKGLNQRFNEMVADDLDTNELDLINNIVEYTQQPYYCQAAFLPLRENTFGTPVFQQDDYTRRKVLNLISKINQRKGTALGYSLLFNILGFDATTITEIPNQFGFDNSTIGFDDPDRVFDNKCNGCGFYSVYLTGSLSVTPALVQSVLKVIDYNEPINAKLKHIYYNGGPLVNGQQITFTIDAGGNLIYANQYDPTFVAWIDGNGDMQIASEFSQFYSVDSMGDIYLTT